MKREKMKKERKKGEQKLALSFYFLREKKWRLLGEVSQTSGLRPWQLGLPPKRLRRPRPVEYMSFSAVCATTSPYDVRITTKISTTCTYYREILTMRALRNSRTTEYYVLLSLRTIEKRKDWIWIGFQSGPAFFVRTIENYVLLSVRTIEKWLYCNPLLFR